MINFKNLHFFNSNPILKEMLILLNINENSNISQEMLSNNIGIGGSMVNNYIKKLKSQNYIYTKGDTNRTIKYYLTEHGQNYLNNLINRYLKEVVNIYKNLKFQFSSVLSQHKKDGIKNVILFGSTEIAELVYNVCKDIELNILDIVDGKAQNIGKKIFGFTIKDIDILKEIEADAIIICSFSNKDIIYKKIEFLKEKNIKIIKF